jgi:hypothetical protein
MVMKRYKKGIKVEVPENSKLWGKKYVKLGNSKEMYWNDNLNCWFCSLKCEDILCSKGVKWPSQTKSKKVVSKMTKSPKQLFTNMTLKVFGKGYLLSCKKTHKDWGTKYYNDGWWNSKQNAWFFKKEFINNLMVNGAVLEESNESSDYESSDYGEEYDELNKSYFKNMVLENYKKGLILKPKKSHKDWGEKYYNGGFWNDTLKSWIFKPESKGFLVNHGAKLSVTV